tara:strand:- start:720 stop:1109 length:390 start_codon:yes stop_codon:yes gene_type:complete
MSWEDILKVYEDDEEFEFHLEESKHFADAIQRDHPTNEQFGKKLEMAGFDFDNRKRQTLMSDIFGYGSILQVAKFTQEDGYEEMPSMVLEFRLKVPKDRRSLSKSKFIYPRIYVYFGARGKVSVEGDLQ